MATASLAMSVLQSEASSKTLPFSIAWVSRTINGNYAVLDTNQVIWEYDDVWAVVTSFDFGANVQPAAIGSTVVDVKMSDDCAMMYAIYLQDVCYFDFRTSFGECLHGGALLKSFGFLSNNNRIIASHATASFFIIVDISLPGSNLTEKT